MSFERTLWVARTVCGHRALILHDKLLLCTKDDMLFLERARELCEAHTLVAKRWDGLLDVSEVFPEQTCLLANCDGEERVSPPAALSSDELNDILDLSIAKAGERLAELSLSELESLLELEREGRNRKGMAKQIKEAMSGQEKGSPDNL